MLVLIEAAAAALRSGGGGGSRCRGAVAAAAAAAAAVTGRQQHHHQQQQQLVQQQLQVVVAAMSTLAQQQQAQVLQTAAAVGAPPRWSYSPHVLPEAPPPGLGAIPPHAIEDGLPQVTAWLRRDGGTSYCTRLRRAGQTPCVLFSLPPPSSPPADASDANGSSSSSSSSSGSEAGSSGSAGSARGNKKKASRGSSARGAGGGGVSLALDANEAARLVRRYGRNGLQAVALQLNIVDGPPPAVAAKAQAAAAAAAAKLLARGALLPGAAGGGGGGGGSSGGGNSSAGGGDAAEAGAAAAAAAAAEAEAAGRADADANADAGATEGAVADGAVLRRVRVLTKRVHINSVTQEVENLRFMFVPPERRVKVDVPVRLWGDDAAPGVKAGGWLHVVNRTVRLVAEGWAVPAALELDVRHMRPRDVVRFRDVPLPPGCRLAVPDPLQPVVRCSLRVGGD